MKIWFPRKKKNEETELIYKSHCKLTMSLFKMCLNNTINVPSLKRTENIIRSKELLDFVNKDNFSVLTALKQFNSYLMCMYDSEEQRCYYTVPNIVRCNNTNNSLEFVIKLLEYGNNYVPPMNIIRHSYLKFCDIYSGGAARK